LDNGDGGGTARNGTLESGEVDQTSYICNASSFGSLRVSALTANNCVASADHGSVTGDDRGGIAWSPNYLHYTGDSATGRFDISGLGSITSLGAVYDGLTNDLDTGTLYALGMGTTYNFMYNAGSFDRLVRLNATTGAVEATIMLSSTIVSPGSSSVVAGMLSGPGFLLLVNATNVYRIVYSTGVVTNMGARPSTYAPAGCENWANWGVAEQYGGEYAMVYRSSSGQIIARTTLADVTTTVATFTNLSDMCCITVNPTTNRWYFHWEGTSQFGGTDESAGYCDATITR
jgi:hypothetical protein